MESAAQEAVVLTSELLDSQARIWNHTLSFINSMALKCAVDLGIPDAIDSHDRPMPLPALAAALSVPSSRAPCLGRLMRMLEHDGVFSTRAEDDGGQGYVLTPVSDHLRARASPLPRLMLDPAMIAPWLHLSSWLLADGGAPTPFQATHGASIWEYAGRHPGFSRTLDEAMAHDAGIVTARIAERCGAVLEGLRTVVDVGGGNGAVARAIARAFPNVACTVYDLPHVIAGRVGSERVEYVSGNMFDWIPPADAIFLKYVLHDFDDKDCVKILKRCREVMSSKEYGGKVIVVEMVANSRGDGLFKSLETQLFFDMLMMVIPGGKEREEHEWRKIFIEAGFADCKILPLMGFLCLIEVFP